jgi:CDP-diacylglycerol--glycerol-3-phosphate 3-phosphatidyltransferase
MTDRAFIDRACRRIAVAGGLGLAAVAVFLAGFLPGVPGAPSERSLGGLFMTTAGAAWALTLYKLWQNRADAKTDRSDGQAAKHFDGRGGYGGLGVATGVTLFRAWLIAIVAGHLLLPPATGSSGFIVGIIYSVAAILDGVDGRIARGHAHVTPLGSRLDVATDALGLLVAPIVAVRAGGLPPWYLLLAIAYPTLRAGLALRARLGLPVFPERLRPNPRARFFAGVQMGVVATALFPVLPRWLLWTAATLAMLPTLLLFLREWRLATDASADHAAASPMATTEPRITV